MRHIALTAGVVYLANRYDVNRCGNCRFEADGSPDSALRRQLQRMTTQITLLGRCTAMERVAAFLVDMAYRVGFPGKTGTVIGLPMKREDIADYLGLNSETVSRLFSKLKARRVIDMPKPGRMILLDQQVLTGLSPVTAGTLACQFDAA